MCLSGVSSASISNMVKMEEMECLLKEAQPEKNNLRAQGNICQHSLTILFYG